MCYSKFVNKSYDDSNSVFDLINYIMNPVHAISQLYGGIATSYLSPVIAAIEFWTVKKAYHKEEGRQIKHLIISFDKSEHVNNFRALNLGYLIAQYFQNKYQIVFAVHENQPNIHIHFIINTVSFVDGLKYNEGPYDLDNLRKFIEEMTGLKCCWDSGY